MTIRPPNPPDAQPVQFWTVDSRVARRKTEEWTSHDGTIRVYLGEFRKRPSPYAFEVRDRREGELLTIWSGFDSSEDAMRVAEIFARLGAEAARKQWRTFMAVGAAIRAEMAGGPPAAAAQLGLLEQ